MFTILNFPDKISGSIHPCQYILLVFQKSREISVINRVYGSLADLSSQNLDKTGAYAMISQT